MIRKADTLGVFQIESRAQMASIALMAPTTFYDLVIEVAIVRPSPIQGDMIDPYRRRRAGLEKVTYPTEELLRVPEKTLGVPLFQEQAMRVAIECAGFSASEADLLRRAMATFKLTGGVSHFKDKLIDGMIARGYERKFAQTTFSQIEGFGSYGFPESHAASFALIAYASSWMKCHRPDAFCAALFNAQPMGFYAPTQIVRDARQHGVEVRPIDVNSSRWDCTVEVAEMGEGAEVMEDYRSSGLSLRAHPLAFLRDELKSRRMITCAELHDVKDGRYVELAGIVLVRQKPGSAKGVMLVTVEDETDVANLVIWTKIFEANARTVLSASTMGVRGQVQREGDVIHVIARRLDDMSPLQASVGGRADVVKYGMAPDPRDPAERHFGKGPRDIYIPDLRLGSGIIPGEPVEGIKVRTRDFRRCRVPVQTAR